MRLALGAVAAVLLAGCGGAGTACAPYEDGVWVGLWSATYQVPPLYMQTKMTTMNVGLELHCLGATIGAASFEMTRASFDLDYLNCHGCAPTAGHLVTFPLPPPGVPRDGFDLQIFLPGQLFVHTQGGMVAEASGKSIYNDVALSSKDSWFINGNNAPQPNGNPGVIMSHWVLNSGGSLGMVGGGGGAGMGGGGAGGSDGGAGSGDGGVVHQRSDGGMPVPIDLGMCTVTATPSINNQCSVDRTCGGMRVCKLTCDGVNCICSDGSPAFAEGQACTNGTAAGLITRCGCGH